MGEVACEDRRKWPLSTRVVVGMAGPRCVSAPRNLMLITFQQGVCKLDEDISKSITETFGWEGRMLPWFSL